VDDAFAIDGGDVPRVETDADQQVEAGDGRRTGTRADQLHLADVLAGDAHAVEYGGCGDDGGAVLVVVEDRNLHALAQLRLDVEAFGRLDVLKIDAAEGRFQRGDDVDELVGIEFVDFNIEYVDAGELLEKYALAFHHGFAGKWADVAEAEHGGAVGNDRDEVAACGVERSSPGVADDFVAGRCDAGGIGKREIGLVGERFCGSYRDLAWSR